MVKVVTVSNVFDKTTRKVEDLKSGRPLLEYAPPWDEAHVRLNGEETHDLEQVANEGDEILFVAEPKGIEVALVSIGVSAWLASAIAFVVNLGISYGVSQLASKLLAPPDPADFDSSPTYAFGNIKVSTQNGTPIPIVYGAHRVAGQVLAAIPKVTETGESGLKLLLGLSEGPIQSIAGLIESQNELEGSDIPDAIRINGNPATNFRNLKVWTRLGSRDQEIIAGFEDQVVNIPVGTEAKFQDPIQNSTTSAVDGFEIIFTHPEGLYSTSKRDGKLRNERMTYVVRWRNTGDSLWVEEVTVSFTAKKTAPFQSVYRNDNPGIFNGGNPVQVDVEVEKLSPPSDQRHKRDIIWASTNEIETGKGQAYPQVALIALDIISQEGLSGEIPNITVDVEGKQVWQWDSGDLDPETTTLTLGYSTNPGYCMADLILSERYGAGHIFDLCGINLPSFQSLVDYCDETVYNLEDGNEKRWELALVLDRAKGFWDHLNDIARCCRTQVILDGQTIKVKAEKPEDPVQVFSSGNIERDSLSMQYVSAQDRENFIEVQFLNEKRDYEHDLAPLEDRERLNDPSTKTITRAVQMYGITRSFRAYRAAQYLLNINRLLLRSIEFRAPLFAVAVEPGDVFYFEHDLPAWDTSTGGLIYADSGNATVTLDFDLTVANGDEWTVYVTTTGSGADVVQAKQIISQAGTYAKGTELNVVSDWDSGDRPVQGDVCAVINRAGSTELITYRVIETELTQDLTMRISALEYNALVYEDTPDIRVDDDVQDNLDTGTIPDNPTGLILTEEVGGIINVSWSPQAWPWAYEFEIWSRNVSEGVTELGKEGSAPSSAPTFTLEGTDVGETVIVSVVPCSADRSACRNPDLGLIGQITLSGDIAPPADVTGLTVTQAGAITTIEWTGIDTDADPLTHYEVWRGNSWFHREVVATTTGTSITVPTTVGTVTYGVRVLATSGRYSEVPPTDTQTFTAPTGEATDLSRDEVGLSWPGTLTNVTVNADGNLELSATSATGTYESPSFSPGVNAEYRVSIVKTSNQFDLATTWASLATTWANLGSTTWAVITDRWRDLAPIWDSNTMRRRAWGGQIEESPSNVTLMIALDTGSGFGDFQPYSPGVYTFTNIKFKLTLTRDDTDDYQAVVSGLNVEITS